MIERHAGDPHLHCKMTPVGFEPTQLALVELESTPLDHSGKVSVRPHFISMVHTLTMLCNLRGVHGIQEFMRMSCRIFFIALLQSGPGLCDAISWKISDT